MCLYRGVRFLPPLFFPRTRARVALLFYYLSFIIVSVVPSRVLFCFLLFFQRFVCVFSPIRARTCARYHSTTTTTTTTSVAYTYNRRRPPRPPSHHPSVPEAPPQNVTAEAVSPTSILVQWQPPLSDRSNGQIVYYKVMVAENGMSDSEADPYRVENVTSYTLEDLKRWTEYKVWVLAGTSVGDGPSSYPITVRTREDGKHSRARHALIDTHTYIRHTHTRINKTRTLFGRFGGGKAEGIPVVCSSDGYWSIDTRHERRVFVVRRVSAPSQPRYTPTTIARARHPYFDPFRLPVDDPPVPRRTYMRGDDHNTAG